MADELSVTAHVTSAPTSMDSDIPAWAIRLEAKVDVALAHHGSAIETVKRDLALMAADTDKKITAVQTVVEKVDTRVDDLERANFITPKGLGLVVVSTVTGCVGFITLMDRLFV